MGKRSGAVENPHIVREFMDGNTRIRIADNYCKDTTPEQVDTSLENIKRIYMNSERRKAMNHDNHTSSGMSL